MRGVALALVLAVVAGCNSLLGIEDLTLVDAVPADGQSMYFVREGTAGYAMTKDTVIESLTPDATHGDDTELRWTTTNNEHALIRFDDLFGTGGIPPGSTIRSATLQLWVTSVGSAVGRLAEVKVDWDEAKTFNLFGPMPGVMAQDRGALLADNLDGSMLGTTMINVTTSLQLWATDPAMNRGWIVVPMDDMAVQVASSEAVDETQRPTLVVEIVAQ